MSLNGCLKNDYLAPLEYCVLGAINFNEPPEEFFVPFNCYFYLKMESLNKKSLHAATLRKETSHKSDIQSNSTTVTNQLFIFAEKNIKGISQLYRRIM